MNKVNKSTEISNASSYTPSPSLVLVEESEFRCRESRLFWVLELVDRMKAAGRSMRELTSKQGIYFLFVRAMKTATYFEPNGPQMMWLVNLVVHASNPNNSIPPALAERFVALFARLTPAHLTLLQFLNGEGPAAAHTHSIRKELTPIQSPACTAPFSSMLTRAMPELDNPAGLLFATLTDLVSAGLAEHGGLFDRKMTHNELVQRRVTAAGDLFLRLTKDEYEAPIAAVNTADVIASAPPAEATTQLVRDVPRAHGPIYSPSGSQRAAIS
jgi:hypothetical protein